MVEGSLDIKYTPKKEVRTYRVQRGSLYTQTKQYDKEGKLEKEIWERDTIEGSIILDGAAYISREKYEELDKKFSSSEEVDLSITMKSAKDEGYFGHDGFVFIIFQGKPYCSSEVIEIEPPLGEEFQNDA